MYLKLLFFGLKMMVKSGLEKSFAGPPCAKTFLDLLIYFIKGRSFSLVFCNKNYFVSAWKNFKKKFCVVLIVDDRWDFQPKISSIFHFEQVKVGWIFHILWVKKKLDIIAIAFYCGNSKSAFSRSNHFSILKVS